MVLCAIMLIVSYVPYYANSAQTQWRGVDATGAMVSEENSPIVVEKEVLTFDINEFPSNYYRDMTDIEILKFWLRKIKAIFSVELKYYPDRGLKWSVDCKEVLRYYHDNLMVSDVFTVYTELKENIKKIEAKQVLLYRQKG